MIQGHVMHGRSNAAAKPRIVNAAGGPGSGLPDLKELQWPDIDHAHYRPRIWGFNATGDTLNARMDPNGVVPYALKFLSSLSVSPWLATVQQYFTGVSPLINPPTTLQVTTPILDDSTSPGPTYNNGSVANQVR